MRSAHSLVTQYAQQQIELLGRVAPEAIAAGALRDLSDELMKHANDMVAGWVRRTVGDYMRSLSEHDQDQLGLPEIGLPAVICVVTPDGTMYVRSDLANRRELAVGRKTRVDNVRAAQAKLDRYDATVELLLPFMQDDLTTVGQAMDLYRQSQPAGHP